MDHQNAIPGFGKPLKTPQYYTQIRAYIDTLRPKATLRTIADSLNRAGFRTPTDLPFSRQTVSNFMRNTSI